MYESFYRLSTKPFGLNPDPDFIFTRRGHELAMAHLRYGISQSTGFVVITGAPGTGKTTLARVLLKELANNTTIVVAHLPSTHLAADDLLRVVADSFGLKYEGLTKPEILKLLNNFLLTCVRERKRTLLVIDEAQNLPLCAFEELRLLANLRLGAKALLQTILLGQEQFRQMLGTQEFSQIVQRVVANYHLVPLTLEETQAYIESRLIHANWQGNPHFSDGAIHCIHEHTEGIPRRINKFCERLLLYGYLEEQTEISQDIVQVVINEFQQETPVLRRRPEDIEIDETALAEPPLTVPYETESESVNEFKDNEEALADFSINTENHNELIDKQDLPDMSFDPATFALMPQEEENQKDKSEPKEQDLIVEPEQEAIATVDVEKPDQQNKVVELDDNNAVAMAHSAQPSFNVSDSSAFNRAKFRVIDGGKESGGSSSTSQFKSNKPQISSTKDIEHKLLKLVLAFQLSPKHFEHLTDPDAPSPKNAGRLLELATTDDNTIATALPQSLRGISQQNLQTAINFYIWEVLLKPGGDDYRVLGLQDDASSSEIKTHYQYLKGFLNKQQAEHKNTSEYISRIEKAYAALTNETEITETKVLPLSTPSKQKSREETDRIEEAYEILSEETIDSAKTPNPPFKKSDSDGKSGAYTKYLVFGLIATAIGVGAYKTQFASNENEYLAAEAEPTTKQSEKAIIFNSTNDSPEKVEESITDNTNIYDHEPMIETASVENSTDIESDDFSLLDDGSDPWSEYSEISEIINDVSDTQEPLEESFAGQPKAISESVSIPQEKMITAPPEITQRPEQTIVAKQPVTIVQPRELPIATLYSDRATTKTVTTYNNIEKVDLINLISNFTTAYEKGDINQFMKLFSINATSFDGTSQTDRNGIEADYIDLFRTTDARQIAIKNIAWSTNGNISDGLSDFVVTVKGIDNDHFEFISGVITFEVEKTQSGVFITQLTYQLSE